MVQYKCDLCSFITDKTTNYFRHLKTKKHLIKLEAEKKEKEKDEQDLFTHEHKKFTDEHEMFTGEHNLFLNKNGIIPNNKEVGKVEKIEKVNKKVFNCRFCSKTFTTRTSRCRHERKYCHKKKEDSNNNTVSIEEFMKLKEKLEEK
ncbi:unnamed protein product, partial [marine sediment metagenome]